MIEIDPTGVPNITVVAEQEDDEVDEYVECGLCHMEDDEMEEVVEVKWVQCEKDISLKWFHQLCVEIYWPDKPISGNDAKWFCCS